MLLKLTLRYFDENKQLCVRKNTLFKLCLEIRKNNNCNHKICNV